ncbi:MAG: cardiolipin synthase [Rhodospirillales bacterium]|nr:MAG: cardiolipin synthase [Rhodospirillales bacterium]
MGESEPPAALIEVLANAALTLLVIISAAAVTAHAILRKRDVRAAIGWVGLAWLVPLIGPALYVLFGVNRIRRRASELRPPHRRPAVPRGERNSNSTRLLEPIAAAGHRHLIALATLGDAINPFPLTGGNAIAPLEGGLAAYREMLAAIEGARHTLGMASYIFDDDESGRMFAEALAAAVARGVAVRVLIDGVGAQYSFPKSSRRLRRMGIPVAEFLPTFVPLHLPYGNLRNHRKLLVADGTLGFTGGMNVRGGYLRAPHRRHAVRDIHFRLEGPVVGHIAATFAEDWAFCTGEVLDGADWFPAIAERGPVAARGIAAGPDEEEERLRLTLLGALARAERRVRILSPYFLPDAMLQASLVLAAMRGVEVEILFPDQSNLHLVQWASRAQIGRLLPWGCRVWLTPPPFDHAKAMTVDGLWSLIGSANWDERSFRLNFEFCVEAFDAELATSIDAMIDARRAEARLLTGPEIAERPLAAKLRDGAAWLLSPYL